MNNDPVTYSQEVEAISKIPAVPTILEVICRTTGMGFTAIARVTDKRWIACAVKDEINFGLQPGGELKVETTICHEIQQHLEPVVIDHVEKDDAFCGHPTPALYGFQSYISVPITLKNGDFFGTLCAIDPRPARLDTVEVRGMFRLFADLIAFYLSASDQLLHSQVKLEEENMNAEQREQFIAVLGHDLRNPVTAIQSSAQILSSLPLPDIAVRLVEVIKRSSLRMTELVDNVTDFASGRMGAGMQLNKKSVDVVEGMITQIIAEFALSYPDKVIETHYDLAAPVDCDDKRVCQLFWNLLSNALKYGEEGKPVQVSAISTSEAFALTVANKGPEIPAAIKQRLFQPFFRGQVDAHKKSLGLGLYIVSEIARAHGGIIDVYSDGENTSFTFRMPQVHGA